MMCWSSLKKKFLDTLQTIKCIACHPMITWIQLTDGRRNEAVKQDKSEIAQSTAQRAERERGRREERT